MAGALGAGASLLPAAALGQNAPVVSRPVVQAVPGAGSQKLNDALARLGRNPRDAAALIDAGDAALALGDFAAAVGFYRRADELSPNSPRIKAGMASALLFTGDPVAAIRGFAEAERAGARPQSIASDRGLAYDLVGDNATAQSYYRTVPGGSGNDELRMRLAISQAIGGDLEAAEQTLMPLLHKQDKPGWRVRAFTLAIAGETKEAVDLVNRILPAQLAQNMGPYLRYMPRLTKAQQAAAANLGKFPRASEIGRDEPRVAAYRPVQVAAADTALIPKGAPLGVANRATEKSSSKGASKVKPAKAEVAETRRQAEAAENRRKAALASVEADRVAPPEPKPAIERNDVDLRPAGAAGELPPVAKDTSRTPATPPAAVPATAPARATTAPRQVAAASPDFDLGRLGGTPPAPPRPVEAPPEPGLSQLSLSEIFADLGAPTLQAAPASGAVDIRMIQPARTKPREEVKAVEKPVEKLAEKRAEKPKKPAPPAHPSRIWVQIGVGRDKGAIAFDWRRYVRQAPALFKGRQTYISEMGRTNRILAGPFESLKAANQFVVDLRKADIEGAVPWTSPAGQVVDQLPAK